MVRIAPVTLAFNPKVLWFEAGDLALDPQDKVVVSTVRGTELGTMAGEVFEAGEEETKNLSSALKPVKRRATEYDIEQARKMEQKSKDALPLFKRLAEESGLDMNPVSVEYLLDGDKAVFYFESEERVDFRELVRNLASQLHIRIDMRQIGVRDEARMIGGLSHCGQELCCKRLGGEFNPVTIRMAKEQNLSLNPQKISGVCGRLMCCLRYEYEAYRDFNGRAPKLKAKIKTPDGIATVVELEAVREMVLLQISDEKPIRVPLADFETSENGARPDCVGKEAWERAHDSSLFSGANTLSFFSSPDLAGADQLATAKKPSADEKEGKNENAGRSRSARREQRKAKQQAAAAAAAPSSAAVHSRKRRRSTMIAFDSDTAQGTAGQDERQSASRTQSASQVTPRKRHAAQHAAGAQSEASKEQKRQVDRRARLQQGRKQAAAGAEGASSAEKQQTRGAKVRPEKGASRSLAAKDAQRQDKPKGKGSATAKPAGAAGQRQAGQGSARPGQRSSGLRQGQERNETALNRSDQGQKGASSAAKRQPGKSAARPQASQAAAGASDRDSAAPKKRRSRNRSHRSQGSSGGAQ